MYICGVPKRDVTKKTKSRNIYCKGDLVEKEH